MAIRLNGSTSGYIEIDAPAVAGTTAITLPATSGGNFVVTDSAGDLNIDSGTFFVDASTNRVGVGTTSPFGALQVREGTDANLIFDTDGTETAIQSFNDAGSAQVPLRLRASEIKLQTSSTERARIDSSGRLLVGRTSTQNENIAGTGYANLVQIEGNATGEGLSVANSAAAARINITRDLASDSITNGMDLGFISFGAESPTSVERARIQCNAEFTNANERGGRLQFHTCANGDHIPTERMRIDNSGRVGIGTTSPAKKLDVYEGSTSTIEQYLRNNTINLLSKIDGTTSAQFGTETSHPLLFLTGNAERARIDTSGRLLVGTSSASGSTNSRAIIAGNTNSAPGVLLIASTSTTPGTSDNLGVLRFSDAGHTHAAYISGDRDGGTWTSGSSHPSKLTFTTTANGASSPTERMRITNAGYVQCKNQPYFMGVLSANQDVSNTTETKIAFTDAADRTSAWDNTNDEFDIQVDGMYLVCLDVQYTTDVNQLHNGIKVNGASPATGFDPWVNSGNDERGASRSAVFNLTSGDNISLWTYQGSGSTKTLEVNRTKVTIAFLG